MRLVDGYRTVALIAIVVFLTLSVGWPIIGAASAVFWRDGSHGGPHSRAVSRVYDAAIDKSAYHRLTLETIDAEFANPNRPECYIKLLMPRDDPNTRSARMNLEGAIGTSRSRLYWSTFERPAYEALSDLPAPLLGMIDGCISGSPLASFCRDYIKGKLDDVWLRTAPERKVRLVQVVEDFDRIWCLATGDLRHAEGTSSSWKPVHDINH